MTSTLEPPAPALPAIGQPRDGETLVVLRIRAHHQGDLPPGNGFGTFLLARVLNSELDAEGIPHDELIGVGPFNAATFLFSTSEPRRAMRQLKAALELLKLPDIFTLHYVDRATLILRCFHAPPGARRVDAATLDDLRVEMFSAHYGLIHRLSTITDTALKGGLAALDADYCIEAVLHKEIQTAAKNQNPPGPDASPAPEP